MTSRLSALAAALTLSLALAPAFAAAPALQKIDTLAGKGRLAVKGSIVTMNYTGWLYSPKSAHQHGAKFDSSDPGKPFTFKLGEGKVIKGWEEGVRGMKTGGKRTLIVPADMAFGQQGFGSVPPTSNLIFDIELVDVK